MNDDRRLIEDYLPIQAISTDLPATSRGSAAQAGGAPAPLIDALHRILWLIENEPRNLNRFLDEARPERERFRLVAQALAGTALEGGSVGVLENYGSGGYTPPKEQAALKKLVANWNALIETRLSDIDRKTG
ncbi:MAG: hypothetical protein JRF59_03995 [Deltaproteobacteria bacterium]|nr:hypothetical protein [Deltaproteobacteria bacterium]MBW1949253.1 hypothetical protein [Deltaproteobacteria bacterium]MBW2006904.1 hypothetical protein [Deltaproteobacteria bacterium]MBW2346990.1 hypothetical protein [Deltaproteobacteria bacterium]